MQALVTQSVDTTALQPNGSVTISIVLGVGGPSPTVILRSEDLPEEREASERLLCCIYRSLAAQIHSLGLEETPTKYAIIGLSAEPGVDLYYRFIQAIPYTASGTGLEGFPGEPAVRFEFNRECGHSLVASVTAACRTGLLPLLESNKRPYSSIVVRSLHSGSLICCQPQFENHSIDQACYTLSYPFPAGDGSTLLPTGHAQETITLDDGRVFPVSLVQAGNPYVFVAATAFGLTTPEALFHADYLYADLQQLRALAGQRLRLPATSVFPKIAFVAPWQGAQEGVLVRSISVPSWHPGFALSGLVCLASAAAVPGSIVEQMLQNRQGLEHAISDTIQEQREIAIAHPSGVEHLTVRTRWQPRVQTPNFPVIEEVTLEHCEARILVPQLILRPDFIAASLSPSA